MFHPSWNALVKIFDGGIESKFQRDHKMVGITPEQRESIVDIVARDITVPLYLETRTDLYPLEQE